MYGHYTVEQLQERLSQIENEKYYNRDSYNFADFALKVELEKEHMRLACEKSGIQSELMRRSCAEMPKLYRVI